MPKENNKMQVDIENLIKQNVNDLSSIKELYRKLKEVEEKISQIKYIDINLANKLKKEYENLKKIILDENIQAKLTDDIETINSQLVNKTYYFTTVADMKSKDVRVGDYVFTTGYYEPNDGGESCYRILPNTDIECNDGNLIKLNNGLIAELIPRNGEVNIVQFGAKRGNKTWNSYNAFQNAINFVYEEC